MLNVEELTIGDIRRIQSLLHDEAKQGPPAAKNPYTIGDVWFFRTVTHHLSGKVKAVQKQEIVLEGGTVLWIADDGRFTELFQTGKPSESEVYGTQDVVIGRGSIIDATRLKINIEVVQS